MTISRAQTAPSLLDGKKISIVGAGPCGLTLARLLQQKGVQVRVFELESSADARNQGGTLDLHEDSGQLALHMAGLHDQFVALSRPEGQALKVVDKDGKVFIDLQPKDEAETRPEIDRGLLRGLLMDSLAPDTIQWGRPLQGAERTDEGRLRLRFEDGQHADADLVFGCDGTWSRVRPFVSTTRPYYCGVTAVECWISSADTNHPDIAQLVGPGIFLATSDDKAIIAQRNGNGNIRLYVTLRVPEEWSQQLGSEFSRPEAARRILLDMFPGWEPQLGTMLQAPGVFIPRPLYTHPPKQAAWHARSDVTLLGDSAHVMPFFTGRGVNLAMLDAVELSENLTSGAFSDIGSAIHAYEETMLARMTTEISTTLGDQDVFISPRAPAGIDDLLRRRIEGGARRQSSKGAAGS